MFAHQSKRLAPHISRAEIVTSELNSVHRFGEAMEVKFWIRHGRRWQRPVSRFKSLTNFSNRQCMLGRYIQTCGLECKAKLLLICHFPSLRLNIGQYYLRAKLSEPVREGMYESLDNICHFEVVQTEEARPWGWHQSDCTYHEKWQWMKNG